MTVPHQESYLACYNGKLIHPTYGQGLCLCGCGAACRTRYIHGHFHRLQGPDYGVRDLGYKTPCWLWLKLLDANGYARVTIHGKNRRATRIYYAHFKGVVVSGDLHLDHLCRNRGCVNPEHLEPIPPASNSRRGIKALFTEDDILRMIQMRESGTMFKDIASYFGTDISYIQAICRGKRWRGIAGQLPQRRPRATPEMIEQVTSLRLKGYCAKEIAQHLGVAEWNIYGILRRRDLGRARFGRATQTRPPLLAGKPCPTLPQTD